MDTLPHEPAGPESGGPSAAATFTDEPVTDDPIAAPIDSPGPTADEAAGSAPVEAPWWRSWWAVAAVALAFLVVVTAVALVSTSRSSDRARADLADAAAAIRETQADLDRAQQELTTRRAELAVVLDKAKAVGDQLDTHTAARNDQRSAVEKARTDLTTLNGVLNNQRLRLFIQAKHMTELSDCINAANAALNLMSFGDRDAGTKILQDSSKKCEVVNDYLASLDPSP